MPFVDRQDKLEYLRRWYIKEKNIKKQRHRNRRMKRIKPARKKITEENILDVIKKNQPIYINQLHRKLKELGFERKNDTIYKRVKRLILSKKLISKKIKTTFGNKTDRRFLAINNEFGKKILNQMVVI